MASLRKNIGYRVLKHKKKGQSREVRVHNFDTAQRVILLFNASDIKARPVIKDFVKFLKDKKIAWKVYAYVPDKEVPQDLLFLKDYRFITRKDVNWFLKPGGEVGEAFYRDEADILLDFTTGLDLELQYLVQLSPASFKIGRFTEEENDYDLMITLGEPCELAYLAEQFKHYVSLLNPIAQ